MGVCRLTVCVGGVPVALCRVRVLLGGLGFLALGLDEGGIVVCVLGGACRLGRRVLLSVAAVLVLLLVVGPLLFVAGSGVVLRGPLVVVFGLVCVVPSVFVCVWVLVGIVRVGGGVRLCVPPVGSASLACLGVAFEGLGLSAVLLGPTVVGRVLGPCCGPLGPLGLPVGSCGVAGGLWASVARGFVPGVVGVLACRPRAPGGVLGLGLGLFGVGRVLGLVRCASGFPCSPGRLVGCGLGAAACRGFVRVRVVLGFAARGCAPCSGVVRSCGPGPWPPEGGSGSGRLAGGGALGRGFGRAGVGPGSDRVLSGSPAPGAEGLLLGLPRVAGRRLGCGPGVREPLRSGEPLLDWGLGVIADPPLGVPGSPGR